MKRKLVKIAFVIAIAVVGGINVFNTQKSVELSDIAFANVEALAKVDDPVACSGFYYVCKSELASFLKEMKRNCDSFDGGYATIDC